MKAFLIHFFGLSSCFKVDAVESNHRDDYQRRRRRRRMEDDERSYASRSLVHIDENSTLQKTHDSSRRRTGDGSLNSGSIISGGEESVLVTWQLDRDFHRPSHFVSRVGQGGILHTLCCMHTGKIIVLCSDNSVQCYHGSNYDRLWMEQGIASMKLHEESIIKGKEEGDTFKKGSIIMQKDPITGFPILSNLPGGESKTVYSLYNSECGYLT